MGAPKLCVEIQLCGPLRTLRLVDVTSDLRLKRRGTQRSGSRNQKVLKYAEGVRKFQPQGWSVATTLEDYEEAKNAVKRSAIGEVLAGC